MFITLWNIFPLNANVCTSLETNLCTSHICDFNLQPFSKTTKEWKKERKKESGKNKQINAMHTHGFSAWKWENWIDTKAGELVEHDVHWVYIHLRVCVYKLFCGFHNNETTILCVCAMEWYDMMWCDVRGKFWWWWRKRQRDRKKVYSLYNIFYYLPRECSFRHIWLVFVSSTSILILFFPSSSLSLDTINRVFLGKICIFRRLIRLISLGMTPMIHIWNDGLHTHMCRLIL